MAIDTKYQDNVVLKQDAFQNLLTNIKNYPIIDIDYIAESDVDELHGDYVWENYTSGIPCIKITYGDDRTTKGNVIFSEEDRIAINNLKKSISQIQTQTNELTKRKNRWIEVYNQNYAVFQGKNNQLARFRNNFNKIQSDKLAFLKAGWDLLYGGTDLNIDDPYKVVQVGATYNPETIYYTHSSEYLFKRYEYTYRVNNNGTQVDVTVDAYSSITPQHDEYDNMRADWANKVANDEIYTKVNSDRGPVLLQELGAQYFSYQNILLNKNPYELVPTSAVYDETVTYYVRGSQFVEYGLNHTSSDDPGYSDMIGDWEYKRNNRQLYTRVAEDEVVKTYNLEYSALGSARASMLSKLLVYRNNKKGDGTDLFTPEQKVVFDQFINFIYAYNKLVLLDTIGIAGYTEADIETLKEEYPTIEAIINGLNEQQIEDFNWEEQVSEYNYNWQSVAQTFLDRIESIITNINSVINTNLIYIRNQIRDINYSLVVKNSEIEEKQADIEVLQNKILDAASDRYDLLPDDAVYNAARDADYFIKTGIDEFGNDIYEHYSESPSADWGNLTQTSQMYIRNDRTMYGYKYVKVGSNITFDNTYVSNIDPYSPGYGRTAEVLEKTNTPLDQASGTFRITINGHNYEVPIKGFTSAASNQPIYIKSEDTSDPTHNPNNFGSINFFGNLVGAGSVVTNNGNIYASGGAVAAGTYLALEGYAGEANFNSAIMANTSEDGQSNNHAGLWYDGSNNRLIRTWNISSDMDNVGLGCYQLVLISNDEEKGTNNGERVGIIGIGNTIEFHTGLPSDSLNTNNNLANIKVSNITTQGNIIVGDENTSYSLIINGQNLSALGTSSDKGHFWRGDNYWSDTLEGPFSVTDVTDASRYVPQDLGSNPIALTDTQINTLINNGTLKAYYQYQVTKNQYYNQLPQTQWIVPSIIGSPSEVSVNSATGVVIGAYAPNTTYINEGEVVTLYLGHYYPRQGEYALSESYTASLDDNSLTQFNNNAFVTVVKTNDIIYYEFLKDSSTYYYNVNGSYRVCRPNTKYPINTTFYHAVTPAVADPAAGEGLNNAQLGGSIITFGGIAARKSIKGYRVYAAVFNDYAECRKTIDLEPGRVVVDQDDGSLKCADKRLQPGAQVISDTYGNLIGEMEGVETPLAVSGRVLVYPYQARENYHAGMAVCSAPDGTVDIMTREEIKEYPDCIIGIVSEIPSYSFWGTNQVCVDGRIWIKVK